MTRRLFDDDAHAIKIINTERRRQALFQIFYTCCNAEERNCSRCFVPTPEGSNFSIAPGERIREPGVTGQK